MKKVIQLILLSFLILVSYILYKSYFDNDQLTQKKIENKIDESPVEKSKDTIKNLKYEVNIDSNNWYKIVSKKSKLNPDDTIGSVEMEDVTGTIKINSEFPIIINSDKAIFNEDNYNTLFQNNVEIDYINYKILADELKLNYNDKLIEISNNIIFTGPDVAIKANNIVIDLIKKKIDIYNEDKIKNVEIKLDNVKY